VFYGSNLSGKDNPRWVISNATETPHVWGTASRLLAPVSGPLGHPVTGLGRGLVGGPARWVGSACGIGVAWLIGLPHRAGARIHAASDAEARWWHWQVNERCGGLVHQYRDARFAVLAYDPAIRRDELRAELPTRDPAPPDCPCSGDL
jgi:hypothetical protein